eukprot:TRINITY_DN31977_c0_g1_i1.p1 TRINITY_DN31977_c0_g1~~TRINITY_DN31977_c0_g1_i1.p1  ORF type:complete len:452 (-),score=57.61 TRINITY_DN31977_c0_g1_i1:187-1542(-)
MYQYLGSPTATQTQRPREIESAHARELVEETKVALEQERLFNVKWWDLGRNKIWLREPMGPQAAPAIESLDDWTQGTKAGQWPLPSGSKGTVEDASVTALCWSFVTFMWRRQHPVGPAFLMFIYGLLPACIATINGFIVKTITAPADDTDLRQRNLLILCASYLIVNQVSIRIFYKFEVDVPEASQRHHLRHVVMRSLLRLRGEAAARFPPGESAGVLGPCVHDAVDNVWSQIFPLISGVAAFGSLLVTMMVSVRGASTPRLVGVAFCILIIPLLVLMMWRCRLRPCIDLAGRQTKWDVKMYAMAVEQITRFRSKGAQSEAVQESDVEKAAQDYSNTAFVFRKRAFHSYFMDLVTQDGVSEFFVIVYTIATLLVGLEVIDGRIDVAAFTSFTSAILSLQTKSANGIAILVGLPHGDAALRVLADVINSDPTLECDGDSDDDSASDCDGGRV